MIKRKIYVFYALLILTIIINGCCVSKTRKIEQKIAQYIESQSQEKEKAAETEVDAGIVQFIEGESFFYKVRWIGLDVGNASLCVKEKTQLDGRPAFHIVLNAQTNKFFSFFYKVEGTVESFIDAGNFKPIAYSARTIINKKDIIKKMKYDFNECIVYAEDKKGKYELAIPGDVLDPLGIFYYFRLNNVVFNEPIKIVVNGGKKNFPITVFVRNTKKMHTPAGSFWAFMVQPTSQSERQFDDELSASGSMVIWFSADKTRIPLVIMLKVPMGVAQAIITKVEIPQTQLTANN